MADLTMPQEVVKDKRGAAYRVKRLTEVAQILPHLEKDRIYAAFALCQLEPLRFHHTRWYLAQGETGEALAMNATGSLGPLFGVGADLFCMGDSSALAAILSLHPGPRLATVWAQVEHIPVVKRFFNLRSEKPALLCYHNGKVLFPVDDHVRRLTGDDVGEFNRLLRSEGLRAFYRRRFIESGVWYGVFEGGRLISVAGCRARAPSYGIAVSGRAFTHPDYRSRGYSKLARSAHIRDTLQECPLMVATVDPNNIAAFQAGQSIGAVLVMDILQTTGFRRDIAGLSSLWRRLLARGRATRPSNLLQANKSQQS